MNGKLASRALGCALLVAATAATACSPLRPEFLAQTPTRVKAQYDAAAFVVVATVIKREDVYEAKPPFPDFKMRFERATFRVDRSFKGRLQPGDTFVIDSGISSCGAGVVDKLLFYVDPRQKKKAQKNYPRTWLIFHSGITGDEPPPTKGPPFEITHSPTSRPVGQAIYDLEVLEKQIAQDVNDPT